jgi:hypothetical protein
MTAALTERTAAVAVRDGVIADLKQAVFERDCKIATAEQQLRDCFHRIKEIEASHSWRITAPYRAIGAFVRHMAALLG